MPQLAQRLTHLERGLRALMPHQANCPRCRGRELLAFPDEPDNVGPQQPYDGPDGVCRVCHMPSPGKRVMRLPGPMAEYFAALPWAENPGHRYIEKLVLFMALARGEVHEAERMVRRLYERRGLQIDTAAVPQGSA